MKGVARPASAFVSILVLAFGTLIALPAWATSYAVQPGDTVIVQGSYSSSDPNDPSEDEPLVVNAGSCSFTTFGTDSCQVRITTAGTFNVTYYVSGGDGDETVNVSVNIIHGPAQPCPIGGGGFGNACTPLPSNGPGAGIAESLLNGTDSQYYNALKSSVGAIGSGLAAVPITVLAQ